MSTPEPRKRDRGLDITLIVMISIMATGGALEMVATWNPNDALLMWGKGLQAAALLMLALVLLRIAMVVGRRR